MITKEIVEAFVRRDAKEFNRLIGLKPWETSPLDATQEECPYRNAGAMGCISWPRAWAMRRELLKVARAMRTPRADI